MICWAGSRISAVDLKNFIRASFFFEFRIVVDELTKDVSLIVTDFAEEDEIDEAKMLWESQISDLKQVLGSS